MLSKLGIKETKDVFETAEISNLMKYDITGKESLRTYLDYERLSFEEMETLFTYLSYAVGEAEEYLLNPGHKCGCGVFHYYKIN